ncbi:MAG TPA: type II secretion system protein [Acholeplasmataceae bacterium]|nr:type II secretion system protein [Acholeplasmataceae bacterium]
MKRVFNHQGFTLLEAIASVAIITLVFTTAIAIIMAMRNQTIATENKRIAVEVASSLRDDLITTLNYATVSPWLSGQEKSVDVTTCSDVGSIVSCEMLQPSNSTVIDAEDIVVTFLAPTAETTAYEIVRFTITVTYYKTRMITIEGVIYA